MLNRNVAGFLLTLSLIALIDHAKALSLEDLFLYATMDSGETEETYMDTSGAGTGPHDGTDTSSKPVSVPSGMFAEALELKGPGIWQAVRYFSYASEFNALTRGTVCSWVKPTASLADVNHTLFSISDRNDVQSYATLRLFSANGQIQYVVFNDGVFSGLASSPSGTSVFDGEWHHVALTVDGGTATLYLDGVSLGSGSAPFFDAILGANEPGIGRRASSPSTYDYYKGLVDDFAIWKRALSGSEIHEIYERGLAGEPLRSLGPDLERIYVNDDATGANDGSSWPDAFTSLQKALNVSTAGDEIWVARGVYRPSGPGGDPEEGFLLREGVRIYGGFEGREDILQQRNADPHTNGTVLSGDIDSDDDDDDGNSIAETVDDHVGTNSFHVVKTQSNLTSASVLDGFVVTAGNSPPFTPRFSDGGGIYIRGYVEDDGPVLSNLCISGNYAAGRGGGICLRSTSAKATLSRVHIRGNESPNGGGLYRSGMDTLVDVIFTANDGDQGGGLNTPGSAATSDTLSGLTFYANTASKGGAVYVKGSGVEPVHFVNSLFVGNRATNGGAFYCQDASPRLTNGTFVANQASQLGSVFHNKMGTSGLAAPSNPQLKNVILWGNEVSDQIYGDVIDAASSHNLIEGGYSPVSGAVVSTSDPMFIRSADSGDDSWDSLGDNDYGNLRLAVGSPALNLGSNEASPLSVDLDSRPRIADTVIDLGVYEGAYSTFASLYPSLNPSEDANGDGLSNLASHAFAMPPEGLQIQSHFPELTNMDTTPRLEFTSPADFAEVKFILEKSSDMKTWLPMTEGNDYEILAPIDQEGLMRQRFELVINPSVARLFTQVRIVSH